MRFVLAVLLVSPGPRLVCPDQAGAAVAGREAGLWGRGSLEASSGPDAGVDGFEFGVVLTPNSKQQ